MYAKTTTLTNPSGLHARPASLFVAEAKNYKSNVTIRRAGADTDTDSEPKNAKSIIMLLALALKPNTEIEIAANGEDEVEAVDKLIELVESGFGE